MTERDPNFAWTEADDAFIRGALDSLREDVHLSDLPEPAFVRGQGRTHRRTRTVLWALAGAAASTAVIALLWSGVGRDSTGPVVPGTSTSSVTEPSPSPSPTSTPSASPTSGPSSSAPATEEMEIAGSKPPPSWKLFIPASAWASPGLTGGAATVAGVNDWEGQIEVAPCDPDTEVTGTVGFTGIELAEFADLGVEGRRFVGTQRVRVLDSPQAASDEAARLLTGFAKGCSFPNGRTTAHGGDVDGTLRLDMVFADKSPTLTWFVGVTRLQSTDAVTTVVISRIEDDNKGFDELTRLLDLARQH